MSIRRASARAARRLTSTDGPRTFDQGRKSARGALAAAYSPPCPASPRSWPSAVAGSRWSPATPCSTTTCWPRPAASARRSASSPPPRATPTTTSCASTATSRPARCEPSHVSLFRRDCGAPEPRAHLLEQDLVYVGGGCVRSMLGAWRAHGLDGALREAWADGVVMCGLSAGSLCWFEQGLTAFHGGRAARRGGARAAPGLQRGALRQGAAAAPGLPRGGAGGHGAGVGRRRRRGAALRRQRARARGVLAPAGERLPGRARRRRAVEAPLAVEYLGAPVSLVA